MALVRLGQADAESSCNSEDENIDPVMDKNYENESNCLMYL